jgi:hypothetical protein
MFGILSSARPEAAGSMRSKRTAVASIAREKLVFRFRMAMTASFLHVDERRHAESLG